MIPGNHKRQNSHLLKRRLSTNFLKRFDPKTVPASGVASLRLYSVTVINFVVTNMANSKYSSLAWTN